MSANIKESDFPTIRFKYLAKSFWLFVLVVLVAIAAFPSSAEAKVMQYLKGNSADVNPPLSGMVSDLGGGGTDVDPAIQWMINQVRGCSNCATKVDVVVIRSPDDDPSDDDAYNQPILDMQGVDSVETLVIGSREDANQPDVVKRIRQAEVIFFAGGDQCNYARNFQRNGLEDAVKSVYARGGGIGGTSAGAMIQSEFIYNACLQGRKNITSDDALSDPYRDISFTNDLFNWTTLKGTIIDTHFDTHDRMGRLMAFIARQIRDGMADEVLGIGLPEATSLVVNRDGMAQVMGKGPVYFVLGDRSPDRCEPGQSLSFSKFKIWKASDGQKFDLKNRPTTGYYLKTVNQGRLSADPDRSS
ncbi:MAG: cyanophycinase [Aulosira sp. ZfuVER01]|nr:Type 1 glutamine amidotransferase-like domain-containing protein [Aulosira sp. ZfuVER01]MDZ8002812.1 Type 1 glutamine amidotransferase-like domain-containing protein [Aulosira sp. DedVER01a]MDZ8054370.1 Type 1 glutamine amidotransferase-like domain-containing protein [Aulosira sp. ZfuCHP01]